VYKVVATDVDATITDRYRRIIPEVIEAFRKLISKGVHIVLISGNVAPVMFAYQNFLGIKDPAVAENGGIVLHRGNLYKYFTKEIPYRAYLHLKEKGVRGIRSLTDKWRETSIVIQRCDPEEVKNSLRGWNVRIETTGYGTHIMNREQSKLFGLKRVLEILNCDLDEVIAFGDSENDVEMIKSSGLGVAVANAWDVVKENADKVAKKPYGYGVVEVLKEVGMI